MVERYYPGDQWWGMCDSSFFLDHENGVPGNVPSYFTPHDQPKADRSGPTELIPKEETVLEVRVEVERDPCGTHSPSDSRLSSSAHQNPGEGP